MSGMNKLYWLLFVVAEIHVAIRIHHIYMVTTSASEDFSWLCETGDMRGVAMLAILDAILLQ